LNKFHDKNPLLNHLEDIEKKCRKGDLNLQDIFDIFGPDGHCISILFFSLPFLQPIPLPGLSTPFGIIISIVGLLAYLEKSPIIPKMWATRRLPAKTVLLIAEGSEKIFKKVSFILHPRWLFLFEGPFRLINLMLLVMNAILLALPLPIPFSNTIPAWAIVFQTLGKFENDGLFIILSYLQTILCIFYFTLISIGVKFSIGMFFQ
jgi:hypothetical protein